MYGTGSYRQFQNPLIPGSQTLMFGPAAGQDNKPSPAPAGRVPGQFAPARRRWASISDDEASPMIWPMKSPLRRAMQPPGRRSQSSTPVIGPAAQPSGQAIPFGDFTAASSAAAAVHSAPFMLPEAGQ